MLKEQRPSTTTSIGQDSGLGISVDSRFSLSSNDTQEEQVPKFIIHSSVIQKAHHNKKNSQQPDTPTLVVSEYSPVDVEESTV